MESSSPIKNFFCDVFGIETKEEKALREEQNSPEPEEQRKPFSPPPPCKAVINLGAWKNYSETMIDDYKSGK